MSYRNIAHQRLYSQFITQQTLLAPDDVVKWLGAVQSQDYMAAKWALALRSQDATDDAIEQAFTAGSILRTHLMRPTWHFVSPADIRWLLALTSPHVNALCAYWYRKLELDDATFSQTNAALINALQGGKQLTRSELMSALQDAGIATADAFRFTYIMMRAELDGVVCSGARRGKQFTYALLDERVPLTRTFTHDEALAELTARYFTSHGPATLQDFVWWSGLALSDARTGLALVASQLTSDVIDKQTYWFSASLPPAKDPAQTLYLLPNYDEYIVGYTNRSAVFDPSHTSKLDLRANILFTHTIVLDGQVVGTWKRTLKKGSATLAFTLFTPLREAEKNLLIATAHRYGTFLALPIDFTFHIV